MNTKNHRPPKNVLAAATQAISSVTMGKRIETKKPKKSPTQTNPVETCGKMSHETKDCYSGAIKATRPRW